MIPFSTISPSIIVSIPNSISFAVSFICPLVASIRIHSNIDIVVLLGTAFETILTPLRRFDFEHINFMCITPFDKSRIKTSISEIRACVKKIYKYIKFNSISINSCGIVNNFVFADILKVFHNCFFVDNYKN